jgi:glutaredoxin
MGPVVDGDDVMRRLLAVLVAGAIALAVMPVTGCRHSKVSAVRDAEARLTVVRPESEGLLLTWIDDKGDFHVETRVGDVPIMGRDTVRVVDPSQEASQSDVVVVADFRQTGADGAYPVRTMSRVDFEAIAVARRQQAGPTLAGAGPAQSAPPQGAQPEGADPGAAPGKPSGRHVVIIYGAEWCGACHEAARYLRRKGVPYVEKDIEKEPEAAREMQQKLAAKGLHGGSIPVIDVRGKIMVGFDPGQIDSALGQTM